MPPLAGSSFQVGGRSMPLCFVMPSQVNLQIPWELAGLTQGTVSATVGGVASGQQAVSLAAFAPGIFIEVLEGSDEALLTLVTCHPFAYVGSAPKRFIVRAHRIPEPGPSGGLL